MKKHKELVQFIYWGSIDSSFNRVLHSETQEVPWRRVHAIAFSCSLGRASVLRRCSFTTMARDLTPSTHSPNSP